MMLYSSTKPSSSKWKGIVFDLDDTLYPERDFVRSGFRAVSLHVEKSLAIPATETFHMLWGLFENGSRGDTFNRWIKSKSLPADLLPELIQTYRFHLPDIQPFGWVQELLSALKKTFLLGLLSDGILEVQRSKLRALRLEHHFDCIVFSDEWGREKWKPSIFPFETLLRKLGLAGEDTVYVADNPVKDFLGARNAGIFTVRLRLREGLYCSLEPENKASCPDVEIEDFQTLRELLID